MWLSPKIFSVLEVAKERVDSQREELAAVRVERDSLRTQLATLQTNFDWIRMQINQLQVENKALMERAYGVRVPVPELVRKQETQFNLQNLFVDDREANGWKDEN